jgi:dipeptidase D
MSQKIRWMTYLCLVELLLIACTSTANQGKPSVIATVNMQTSLPTMTLSTPDSIPTEDTSRTLTQPVPSSGEISSLAPKVHLKDALDSLEPQEVFQNFYSITQIPRPSGQTDQMREFLVNYGNELGLETLVDETGNVLIRKPASQGLENRKRVVLQAHMDMVPQTLDEKNFDFTTEPIQAFVDGDYIVTDGTTLGADDGIGMAISMAILQSKTLQTGPLEALFTVDEETTMSGASGLDGDFIQGRTLINLDGEVLGEFIIGAAGGERVSANITYDQAPAPTDMSSYVVRVQGLEGGHSGVDINKGRGHATKLLVRLLKGAEEAFGLRLASLSGGSVANAIPRDAEAVIFLPKDQVDAFTAYIKDYEATIRKELTAVESDITVTMEAVQPPTQVMEPEFQATLLNALYGTPQGVGRMSDAVPGLVETSNNLGIVTVRDGQMELVCTARSSVDSELLDMEGMITSVWELAGFPVEASGRYSAWTPNPSSPILDLMKSTYQELFGEEAIVTAVHAGLETGTIGAIYPDMDMISLGPTMKDVHSPTERLYIPSVGEVMSLLSKVLQNIPVQSAE